MLKVQRNIFAVGFGTNFRLSRIVIRNYFLPAQHSKFLGHKSFCSLPNRSFRMNSAHCRNLYVRTCISSHHVAATVNINVEVRVFMHCSHSVNGTYCFFHSTRTMHH